MYLFWLGIAAIFFIIYLRVNHYKTSKTKNYYAKALDAKSDGNDSLAIKLFKEALLYANEKPDTETDILLQLKELYVKHNVAHDFGDYETLIGQFQVLSEKSSTKSIQELVKVNQLKAKLLERMPELS